MRGKSARAIVALACAAALAPAAAGGIYKWTDENGQVHYTQTPPPDRASEQLKGPPKVDTEAARQALEAREQAYETRRAEQAEQDAERAKAQAERSEQAVRCREWQTELERLQNAQRIYETGADDSVVRVSEPERQARIEKLREGIAKDCGGGSGP